MQVFIQVVIVLAIVGLILWLVNTYLPIDPKFKQLINLVCICGAVYWLIAKFLLPALH